MTRKSNAMERLTSNPAFKADWIDGTGIPLIMKRYKCSQRIVYRAVSELDLPRRNRPGGRPSNVKVKPVEVNARRETEAPEIPETPTFQRMHDLSIWATKGSHSRMCDLAEIWGVQIRSVQARWHRLRACA